MSIEFKKGSLVTLKSGSGTMVVTGTPEGLVEVMFMGTGGIQSCRVPACAVKAVEIKKTHRSFLDREVVTKSR
jgi:uncharacterized protein YodC (DUF2158 family)